MGSYCVRKQLDFSNNSENAQSISLRTVNGKSNGQIKNMAVKKWVVDYFVKNSTLKIT